MECVPNYGVIEAGVARRFQDFREQEPEESSCSCQWQTYLSGGVLFPTLLKGAAKVAE